jgi:hypothetical protein
LPCHAAGNQVQQIELLGKLMFTTSTSVNRNEACAFCQPETGFTGRSELN